MACDSKITRPIDSFIKYFGDIKPYHTKILEIVEQYIFREDISIETQEKYHINAVIQNDPLCDAVGFGLKFDSECGFDALDCCDLFDCVGGYGLIFDNSDLLKQVDISEITPYIPTYNGDVSTPFESDDISDTFSRIIISGSHVEDTFLNIKSIPSTNTIIVSGNQSEYFTNHKLFWVVPKNIYPIVSHSGYEIVISGNHKDQLEEKNKFHIQDGGYNDGLYGVASVSYSNNQTKIITDIEAKGNILGNILIDSSTKNNALYQILDFSIVDGDTKLVLHPDTLARMLDSDVNNKHGSIQLRTGFIPNRKARLVHRAEYEPYDDQDAEWKIVQAWVQEYNGGIETVVILDGGLGGLGRYTSAGYSTLCLYGYETGAGFDGENECSESKPHNIGISLSEFLSIEAILPPEPTPTVTPTITPTITVTPTPSPTPSSTPEPINTVNYVYSMTQYSNPYGTRIAYGEVDLLTGSRRDLASFTETTGGIDAYEVSLATNGIDTIFCTQAIYSGSSSDNNLRALRITGDSINQVASYQSPVGIINITSMAGSGNTIHILENGDTSVENSMNYLTAIYFNPDTLEFTRGNSVPLGMSSSGFDGEVIMHGDDVVVYDDDSNQISLFSWDGENYSLLSTLNKRVYKTDSVPVLSSDGTYIYAQSLVNPGFSDSHIISTVGGDMVIERTHYMDDGWGYVENVSGGGGKFIMKGGSESFHNAFEIHNLNGVDFDYTNRLRLRSPNLGPSWCYDVDNKLLLQPGPDWESNTGVYDLSTIIPGGELLGNSAPEIIIPDGSTEWVGDTFEVVGDNNYTSSVDVYIDISHDNGRNLKIELYDPSGESYMLQDMSKETEYGYSGNQSWGKPNIGPYVPRTYRVLLKNSLPNANGTWGLWINDSIQYDEGTLNSWSISTVPTYKKLDDFKVTVTNSNGWADLMCGSIITCPELMPVEAPTNSTVLYTQGYGVAQKYDLATGASSADYDGVYQPVMLEMFTHSDTNRVMMVDSGGVAIYTAGESVDAITTPIYITSPWMGGSYTGTRGQGSIDPLGGDAFFCRGRNDTVMHIKPDNSIVDYPIQRPNKICAIGSGRFIVMDEWNGAISLFGPENSYSSPYATVPNMWSCTTAPVFDNANGRVIFQIDNFATGNYEIGFVDVVTGDYTGINTDGLYGDSLAYSSVLDQVVFAPASHANYGKLQVYSPVTGLVRVLDYTVVRNPATVGTTPEDLAIIGSTLAVLQEWSDGVYALHLIDLTTGSVVHTKEFVGIALFITANDRDNVFYVGSPSSNWVYSVTSESPYTDNTITTIDTDNRIVGWI